ncbi:uncharacterized protein LAESUDRAFT_732218 [Laetiporus sulphureus 93-53]|uniref:Uncharacterized protein n=1 Tax=Laetiporus sulphureus 93-53 TaxID=1314785 RepID=A0A165B9F7_9APHY|nr:uncharacterized protein LAESUDRAFT_732218 [Laetiporus sulphureus 93-53]KZT00551.1 hypothetical protein LAESUDRAFT_732218 [Laetiporus sulphureus 93-53]
MSGSRWLFCEGRAWSVWVVECSLTDGLLMRHTQHFTGLWTVLSAYYAHLQLYYWCLVCSCSVT